MIKKGSIVLFCNDKYKVTKVRNDAYGDIENIYNGIKYSMVTLKSLHRVYPWWHIRRYFK